MNNNSIEQEYIQFKKTTLKLIDQHLMEYKKEYKETPWYHNTSNCILEGKINILKILKKGILDHKIIFTEGEEGCYIGGGITALEKLKHDLIFNEDEH